MVVDKRLYNKVVKLAREHQEQSNILSQQIKDTYGIHYSDLDIDDIIDTLDYGYGKCSFSMFCDLMKKYSKESEELDFKNGSIREGEE